MTYNWAVLKKPLLYIYVLTLSMSDSSFGNAFMMVPTHAVDIGVSRFNAVFLVSVMGITDGVSRLLTGWLADFDKVEKKHIYKASIALCALLFFVFPLVKRYVDLAVVCALCGLVSGSFVVLAPVLLAEELGSVNIPVTYGVMYRYVMHSLFTACLQFYRDLHSLSACPPVRLSACPPVRLSACPPVRLSACPPVRLSVSPSLSLSVCLCVLTAFVCLLFRIRYKTVIYISLFCVASKSNSHYNVDVTTCSHSNLILVVALQSLIL